MLLDGRARFLSHGPRLVPDGANRAVERLCRLLQRLRERAVHLGGNHVEPLFERANGHGSLILLLTVLERANSERASDEADDQGGDDEGQFGEGHAVILVQSRASS